MLARFIRRTEQMHALRTGRFAKLEPLSQQFGYDRGSPIDRFYIEAFLSSCAADIRGGVLEIGDDGYSRRFGSGVITRQDILHVHAGNPIATIVGDLSDPSVLPDAGFDCIILTQTIHLIYDMAGALRQVRRALKPNGVVLLTAPGITPIDRGEWGSTWYWSLSPVALRRLVADVFLGEEVRYASYGNLFSATAFLHGAAQEEVDRAKLLPYDPAFPVIVAACARRRPA